MKRTIRALLLLTAGHAAACSTTQIAKDKAEWSAIIQCAETNPQNANELSAALACILDVAVQDPAACALLIPPTKLWNQAEIQCATEKAIAQVTAK